MAAGEEDRDPAATGTGHGEGAAGAPEPASEPAGESGAALTPPAKEAGGDATPADKEEPAHGYRVELDLFEGPLDLLLHLIKKNEVDVGNIPVARITEQYLGYLDLMRSLNLDVAGEFLVMAATLSLIKSRMLLPAPEGEEEAEETDPRADLVRQLLEYQRYREAAQAIADRPRLHRDVFTREAGVDGLPPQDDGTPQFKVTLWQLLEAFREVLRRKQIETVHEVVVEPVSLRERMESMLHTLARVRSRRFDQLFDEDATRLQVIVTFLATLELMKMGAVMAVQEETFGPIMVVLAVEDPSEVDLVLQDEYDGTTPRREGGHGAQNLGNSPAAAPPPGSQSEPGDPSGSPPGTGGSDPD